VSRRRKKVPSGLRSRHFQNRALSSKRQRLQQQPLCEVQYQFSGLDSYWSQDRGQSLPVNWCRLGLTDEARPDKLQDSWSMDALLTPRSPRDSTLAELLTLRRAYLELTQAAREARQRRWSPRQNPIPLLSLHPDRVGSSVVLWLLYQSHIIFQYPGSRNGDSCPDACGSQRFNRAESGGFALTETGETFAEKFLSFTRDPAKEEAMKKAGQSLRLGRLTPCYDRDCRLFTWGRHILKHFRQPSYNQELILCAGEELDWPAWFDDPLPLKHGTNPKTRLHDTLKDLNRRQTMQLVHFMGDGTGRRVGWGMSSALSCSYDVVS